MLRIAIIFGVLLGIVAWAANPHACRPAIQGEQTAPVPATAVGVLKGDTATNTGIDADGFYFSVITVTSITAG